MKKRVFEGVATALITPMNDDTTVNYKRLESLVDEQIKGGVDALVICGTTGEKSTLRYDEHLKVIEVSVKAAKKRVPIIAGRTLQRCRKGRCRCFPYGNSLLQQNFSKRTYRSLQLHC